MNKTYVSVFEDLLYGITSDRGVGLKCCVLNGNENNNLFITLKKRCLMMILSQQYAFLNGIIAL